VLPWDSPLERVSVAGRQGRARLQTVRRLAPHLGLTFEQALVMMHLQEKCWQVAPQEAAEFSIR